MIFSYTLSNLESNRLKSVYRSVNSRSIGSSSRISRTKTRFPAWAIVLLLAPFGMLIAQGPASAQDSNDLVSSGSAETSSPGALPEEEFVPDFDDQDLAGTQERAWEFRPYRVAVWFCLDGSPGLNSTYDNIAADVTRRSELLDPSGWDLETGRAPSKWSSRFLRFIETPERCVGFSDLETIQNFDKVMIVCLHDAFGMTAVRVREFDIQTQQWGPLLVQEVSRKNSIGQTVMDSIRIAFMPLARIDRVTEIVEFNAEGIRKVRDEVVMQVRSIRSCMRTELNQQMEWMVQPIEDSPVFIREDDRFLPVIRRTNRKGELLGLEPIQFTFLTINSSLGSDELIPPPADAPANDESETADTGGEATTETEVAMEELIEDDIAILRCSIESSRRAPLSQRKSKRAQKLALVIRPPQRSTTLFLFSNDEQRVPMEGFEIWSRRPGAVKGEPNEFLGKTDWEGSIEIPPSRNGMRLIFVSRGARRIMRLPIMPGLYESVAAAVPNDETRLYAQGVILGLQNELLSLVIRREVFEAEIKAALEKKDSEKASESFEAYRKLVTLSELKNRLSENLVQLKLLTSDPREVENIEKMFATLRKILTKKMAESKEMKLLEQVQNLSMEVSKQTP